jgi:hypothetical protein
MTAARVLAEFFSDLDKQQSLLHLDRESQTSVHDTPHTIDPSTPVRPSTRAVRAL